MFYGLAIFFYIIVCIALIIVILLQSSKGGGLAGAFGGSGDMGAVFGGRGAATFLSRATGVLAALFLAFSLLLSLINRGRSTPDSVVAREQERRASAPAAAPASGLPIVPNTGSDNLLPVESQDAVSPQTDSAAQ